MWTHDRNAWGAAGIGCGNVARCEARYIARYMARNLVVARPRDGQWETRSGGWRTLAVVAPVLLLLLAALASGRALATEDTAEHTAPQARERAADPASDSATDPMWVISSRAVLRDTDGREGDRPLDRNRQRRAAYVVRSASADRFADDPMLVSRRSKVIHRVRPIVVERMVERVAEPRSARRQARVIRGSDLAIRIGDDRDGNGVRLAFNAWTQRTATRTTTVYSNGGFIDRSAACYGYDDPWQARHLLSRPSTGITGITILYIARDGDGPSDRGWVRTGSRVFTHQAHQTHHEAWMHDVPRRGHHADDGHVDRRQDGGPDGHRRERRGRHR